MLLFHSHPSHDGSRLLPPLGLSIRPHALKLDRRTTGTSPARSSIAGARVNSNLARRNDSSRAQIWRRILGRWLLLPGFMAVDTRTEAPPVAIQAGGKSSHDAPLADPRTVARPPVPIVVTWNPRCRFGGKDEGKFVKTCLL